MPAGGRRPDQQVRAADPVTAAVDRQQPAMITAAPEAMAWTQAWIRLVRRLGGQQPQVDHPAAARGDQLLQHHGLELLRRRRTARPARRRRLDRRDGHRRVEGVVGLDRAAAGRVRVEQDRRSRGRRDRGSRRDHVRPGLGAGRRRRRTGCATRPARHPAAPITVGQRRLVGPGLDGLGQVLVGHRVGGDQRRDPGDGGDQIVGVHRPERRARSGWRTRRPPACRRAWSPGASRAGPPRCPRRCAGRRRW